MIIDSSEGSKSAVINLTWYDMIWMEKFISKHVVPMPAIKSIKEIENEAERTLESLS